MICAKKNSKIFVSVRDIFLLQNQVNFGFSGKFSSISFYWKRLVFYFSGHKHTNDTIKTLNKWRLVLEKKSKNYG